MDTSTISSATLRDLEVLTASGVPHGFYLAGGTGLAMHLAHRESYDLDFFSVEQFGEDILIERLAAAGSFSIEKKETGTVRGTFQETLVSFFYYSYPLLEPCMPVLGIQVASVSDIACMKLDALASRGAKRDFIDIYCILQENGLSLARLLELFEKKYAAVGYNLMHVKKGLVYFEDAEHEPTPRMRNPVAWDKVKEFFIDKARDL